MGRHNSHMGANKTYMAKITLYVTEDVLQIKHDHINIWIISWLLQTLKDQYLIKHTISDGLETNQFLLALC